MNRIHLVRRISCGNKHHRSLTHVLKYSAWWLFICAGLLWARMASMGVIR